MSVTSEFLRSIRNYIDFLRPLETEFARTLARNLVEAERHARVDLSEAAENALELLRSDGPDGVPLSEIGDELTSLLETEQYEFLSKHLIAISCSILGR
ncbi:MAG: hypothetical protein HRU01_08060 [Myxococcales bacterium]|nr:hypothetical protein [Myxococcales bacterium]